LKTASSLSLRIGRVRSAALVTCLAIAIAGSGSAQVPSPPRVALANPASQNCVDKGGSLSIEKNGKGGQFGVCMFADNLQCEEWAMMRGACRTGGIKVTGYVTPAARYCAITGGAYQVTAASNTPVERGTCTLASGKRCAAQAYFDGACTAEAAAPAKTAAAKAPVSPPTIRARFACSGGKTIDATFVNGARNSVKLVLSDGRTLSLPQGPSGSGARYVNNNESVVFWNKGDTAKLEEGGKTTYEGCTTKP
jgi:putative hemolysin